MALYEAFIIAVALSVFFMTLTAVLYVMCNNTGQQGKYETEETKTDSDPEDISNMTLMYNNGAFPIPQRREWFI